MTEEFRTHLTKSLAEIEAAGLFKRERILTTPQSARVAVADTPAAAAPGAGAPAERRVLNFCANNYLGLADNPEIIAAAHAALDRWGYGLSSVRFICGTQLIHQELEAKLSAFLGTDDTILYGSCFDANGGLFETLLGEEDAIISASLNHASIIDGVRLCKAKRFRYQHDDMGELEERLNEARTSR